MGGNGLHEINTNGYVLYKLKIPKEGNKIMNF